MALFTGNTLEIYIYKNVDNKYNGQIPGQNKVYFMKIHSEMAEILLKKGV